MNRKVNGTAVATIRKALGISQASLAARAGITPPFLSQIEHGARPASVETMRKLADGLEVPLAAISYVTHDPGPEQAAS